MSLTGKWLILRQRDSSAEALSPSIAIFETLELAKAEAERRATKAQDVYICEIVGSATRTEKTTITMKGDIE